MAALELNVKQSGIVNRIITKTYFKTRAGKINKVRFLFKNIYFLNLIYFILLDLAWKTLIFQQKIFFLKFPFFENVFHK